MLVDPILEFEKQNPQAPCLYRLQGDQWISYSRAEVVDAVYRLCTQWQSDELKPGQRLLVLMENRPEWAVAAIACNLYGLVLVPAYTTHQEHEIDYLLDKSQASAVVTSDGELSDRLKSVDAASQLLWYAADNQSEILFPNLRSETKKYPLIKIQTASTPLSRHLVLMDSLNSLNLPRTIFFRT